MKAFSLIGIPLKTNNKEAMSTIPQHWKKFSTHQNKIPNKKEPEVVYGVYTDYDNDQYTLIIGCEVTSLEEIPPGMVGITVPEQTYKTFPAEGPPEKAIPATWQQIWNTPLNRAYTYDFERYGDTTEIFIATLS